MNVTFPDEVLVGGVPVITCEFIPENHVYIARPPMAGVRRKTMIVHPRMLQQWLCKISRDKFFDRVRTWRKVFRGRLYKHDQYVCRVWGRWTFYFALVLDVCIILRVLL